MYKLAILEYKTGKFGFVGNVPMILAFEIDDSMSLVEYEKYVGNQMRLPSKFRTLKYRRFDTKQDALNAAKDLNIEVNHD